MSRLEKRKAIFWIVITALIIAALTACTASTPQPQAVPAGSSAGTPQEVQRITLEDSKAALDSGSAVFLDVRSTDAYATSHIPGAVLIPLAELEARMNELDPDQWIITYCTWPAEESSARAAETLLQNGFTRVNPILGGFGAWVGAGYPVEGSQ